MLFCNAARLRRELAAARADLESALAKLRTVSQEAQLKVDPKQQELQYVALEMARAEQVELTAKAEADRYSQQLREQRQFQALWADLPKRI